MRPILLAFPLLFAVLAAAAQNLAVVADATPVMTDTPEYGPVAVTDQKLEDFLWQNRLVVVFAETERDPAFVRQMEMLRDRPEALADQDIVVLTDTDPSAATAIRTALRPRGFGVVIVDKDGKVLFRKPSPWDVREITRAIQKTPLRQQELREMRDTERRSTGIGVGD